MKTDDFAYDLPQELIAQKPLERRDASRMMVLHRSEQTIEHRYFRDLPHLLRPNDVIVFNRSRVIPARLQARKANTGGRIELLLLRRLGNGSWESLIRGRRVHEGLEFRILNRQGEETAISGRVENLLTGGTRVVSFDQAPTTWLDGIGHTPLPPYIHEPLANPERYQTVFAREDGSAAAPTAGLHFTESMLAQLADMNVQLEYVTLHIGLDTFRPVKEEEIEKHQIHSEWCELDAATAERLNAAKREARRLIAVGTTTVRVLETAALIAKQAGAQESILPFTGDTTLFIKPGFQFRAVDAMLTNFHIPRSTLIVLVSAFAGREFILRAYEEAVRHRYRFFSFGDSMLIV